MIGNTGRDRAGASAHFTASADTSRFAAAAVPPYLRGGGVENSPAPQPKQARTDERTAAQFSIDEEYVRNYASIYGSFGATRSRPISAAMFFFIIFLVGAAAGLAGAWWAGNRPLQAGANLHASSAPSPSPPPRTSVDAPRSAALSGISPSELPYDGARPTEAGEPEPTGTNAPSPAGVAQGPVPQPSKEKASAGITAKNAPVSSVKSADAKGGRARTASPHAVVRQDSHGGAAALRNREIDRIRRQANEELKKKTADKPVAAGRISGVQRTARGAVDHAHSVRVGLQKCERASNFIAREACRWRLCNGQWGKRGCPSYAVRPPSV